MRRDGILLAAILAGALALRVVCAWELPFNGDESLTVLQAAGNAARYRTDPPRGVVSYEAMRDLLRPSGWDAVGVVASLRNEGMHPPLYHAIVHALLHLGDHPILWMRALSIGLSIASLLLIHQIGTRLLGAPVGLLAAAAFGASRLGLSLGVLTRPYGLAMLLALLATLQAIRITQADGWRLRDRSVLLFALTLALGLYTTYQFCFVVAFALLLAALLDHRPATLRTLVGVGVLVAIAFAPWIPVVLDQMELVRGAPQYFDRPVDPLKAIGLLTTEQLELLPWPGAIAVGAALLGVLALAGFVRMLFGVALPRAFALAFALHLVVYRGVEAAFAMSTLSTPRFLFLIGPATALFEAAGAWLPRPRAIRGALAAALLAFLAGTAVLAAADPPMGREGWIHSFAKAIDRAEPRPTLIVFGTRARRFVLPTVLEVESAPDFAFLTRDDPDGFDPHWERYDRIAVLVFRPSPGEVKDVRLDAEGRARLDAELVARGYTLVRQITAERHGRPEHEMLIYERPPGRGGREEPPA